MEINPRFNAQKQPLSVSSDHRKLRWFCVFSGFAIFISALLYYVIFRSHLPWPGYLLNLDWVYSSALSDASMGGYPSFAFTLSFGLWAIALFAPRRRAVLIGILGLWCVGLLHEVSFGTFDMRDVRFATLGSVLTVLIALGATRSLSQQHTHLAFMAYVKDRGKMIAMLLVSLGFATASTEYGTTASSDCVSEDENGICIERRVEGSPVFLSFDELRSAVRTETPREMSSVSRIYLYKNYLFINEQNQGVHVIDNSSPMSPQRIAFVAIPGNTEISVRSDNLYADSYVDLVTLDVSDINNITEIAREQDIFPYNARQNIPENIRLVGEIDRSFGVVVGYR